MYTDFEAGYTPTNLRLAIEKLGISQKQASELCGVAERTLRQWLNEDLESRNHADMPHRKWKEFYALNDARNGLLYVRSVHGELYGVGFDRVEAKAKAALGV